MGSTGRKTISGTTLWIAGSSCLQAGILNQQSSNTYLLIAILLLLILGGAAWILLGRQKKLAATQATLLEEKEEKIQWLRRINAENEHRWQKKEQEQEREIQSLKHEIEKLESQAKSGSKNQVVSKIEALREQRAARLSQLSSSH